MSQTLDRLERLISDETNQYCYSDVTARLAELEALATTAGIDQVEADTRVLSALASDTRYRIVRLLAAANDELCVCEITPLVDVSDSAISHALAELTDAGLVDRRKSGRWRYYRITERGNRLVAALDDTRSG